MTKFVNVYFAHITIYPHDIHKVFYRYLLGAAAQGRQRRNDVLYCFIYSDHKSAATVNTFQISKIGHDNSDKFTDGARTRKEGGEAQKQTQGE